MKVAVKTLENKAVGDIELNDDVFGIEPNVNTIHQMVVYQQDKSRKSTAKAKERHEISGTGKKPHAQKGTGRARAGDLKRNIDRGGGVVHGPRVRSHETALPRRIKRLAMKSVLSTKAKEGKLIILDKAEAKDHKTKNMAAAMKKLGIESAVIVGGQEIETNFARAMTNIPKIDVLPSQGANVYDMVRRDVLILTKDAVSDLTERLKD